MEKTFQGMPLSKIKRFKLSDLVGRRLDILRAREDCAPVKTARLARGGLSTVC